jgi:polyhydroxybutyrate depolymerase
MRRLHLIRLTMILGLGAAAACGGDDGTSGADDGGADTVGEDAVGDVSPDAVEATEEDIGGEDFGGEEAGDGTSDVPGVCPRPGDPGPGDHTLPLAFGGLDRSFIVHVPPGYDPTAPTPVVFNFHGYSSNAAQEVFFSNMNPTADARGFVVVYPDGYHNSWNAGACCGDAAAEGIDDVAFVRALVDEVDRLFCIDRARLFAAGMSNGGYLSYRLACEAADLFAGFAPVAGGIGITGCAPSRPVPLIAYHGTVDSMVPFTFGEESFHQYARLAGCTGDPVRTAHGTSYCDAYETCDDGVRVGFCALEGMDHCWPGGAAPRRICETFIGAYSEDLNANENMWDFFNP